MYFHVRVKIDQDFTVKVYRKGLTDTLMLTDTGSATFQTLQADAYETGCGWDENYSIKITTDWQSGAYIARFTTTTGTKVTVEVLFIVRPSDPGIATKILFQSSINTAQAYNGWGGKSLYDYNSDGVASYKVSFNRPMDPDDFYRWELPFIQWLEKIGYTVEFCTNVDLHSDGDLLNNYKLFLSVGHDEYWTWEMRDNIDLFINAGGNAAFFSGNVSWWQARLEAQDEIDNRVLVCYRKAGLDPESYPKKTIHWFEDGVNRPENLMTGVSYYNGAFRQPETVPDERFKVKLFKHWLFKDTGLQFDSEFGVYDNTSLDKHYKTIGYETDAADYNDLDINFPVPTGNLPIAITDVNAPMDFTILAAANLSTWSEVGGISLSGSNNHNGWVTMGIYRRPLPTEGGFGFTVGTTDWVNGLLYIVEHEDDDNWNEVHQITINVLDALGGGDIQDQKFLIDNPGFEDWDEDVLTPLGWVKAGAGTISREDRGHDLGYCLKVDATEGQTWITQNNIPVRTDRQYRVTCKAKGSDPLTIIPEGSVRIMLQSTFEYADEFAIASYTGSDEWEEISNYGTSASVDFDFINVRVKIQVEEGYIAYFDDVVVEEIYETIT